MSTTSGRRQRGAGIMAGLLFLGVFAAGVGLGRCTADTIPTDDAPTEILIVPTCAELERSGYDGVASCVDVDGNVVRPGASCGPEAVRGSDGTADCLSIDGDAVPQGGGS